jgi:hypothetical protein
MNLGPQSSVRIAMLLSLKSTLTRPRSPSKKELHQSLEHPKMLTECPPTTRMDLKNQIKFKTPQVLATLQVTLQNQILRAKKLIFHQICLHLPTDPLQLLTNLKLTSHLNLHS